MHLIINHIIDADDAYFNLEALRIVFKNLELLQFCQFVSDGKQVADLCIQNYRSSKRVFKWLIS